MWFVNKEMRRNVPFKERNEKKRVWKKGIGKKLERVKRAERCKVYAAGKQRHGTNFHATLSPQAARTISAMEADI